MTGAHVYRAFDAAGRLLYVGCSVSVEARLRQHETNSLWWVFKDRVEGEWFDDQDEALQAEAEAIATEHPRWNMVGRSDEHPDGQCSSVNQAKWLDYDRDVASRHRSLLGQEARLLREIRKVRMGLAGTRLEVQSISGGYEFEMGDVA